MVHLPGARMLSLFKAKAGGAGVFHSFTLASVHNSGKRTFELIEDYVSVR